MDVLGTFPSGLFSAVGVDLAWFPNPKIIYGLRYITGNRGVRIDGLYGERFTTDGRRAQRWTPAVSYTLCVRATGQDIAIGHKNVAGAGTEVPITCVFSGGAEAGVQPSTVVVTGAG